ncbi:methionyl-tRNA formyltransferase, mitochondrial [Chironomus tepperi]|uniref:methionyl-tRNA formyltransferase, mitochondrial n=1 Tax=Chironomus tepperi TaxID=113505 RepID=UPI00391FA641
MILRQIFKDRILLRISVCKNFAIIRNCSSHNKVLFFGTDNFSLPTLKILSRNNNSELISRLEVVTSLKSIKNPVKQYALENQLKVHNWEDVKKDHRICHSFDFGLVVSFGHLIPEYVINSFKNGMLNVHASLLPKYRGASPIIYALKDHQNVTGVTVMKIEPAKFDVGDILAKKEVSICDNTFMPELHDKLANVGAELLLDCIKGFHNIKPIKQDNSKASYAPKITNEFCKVRWKEMTAMQIFDLYRSLYSFKNLTTTFRNEQVKLLEISRTSSFVQNEDRIAGQIKFCWKSKKLLVRCVDGLDIEINKLSISKKVMTAKDFNNGFLRKRTELENIFE